MAEPSIHKLLLLKKTKRRLTNNDAMLLNLNLESKQIGDSGLEVLAPGLSANTTLINLNLRNNNLADDGAFLIAKVLKENATLTTLQLAFNDFSEKGSIAIAMALGENTHSKLATIGLQHNHISDQAGIQLGEVLANNKTLTALELAVNRLGPKGCGAISTALAKNTALTHLDIADNQVGAQGIGLLAKSLKTNTTLVDVTARKNAIGADGARLLADGLGSNETLTTLCLRNNNLQNDGAEALANMLAKNYSLLALELEFNAIKQPFLSRVHKLLKRNQLVSKLRSAAGKLRRGDPTLQTLDLAGMRLLGAEAERMLQEMALALAENTVLEALVLSDTGISRSSVRLLSTAMEENKSVRLLSLRDNALGLGCIDKSTGTHGAKDEGSGCVALAESLMTNSDSAVAKLHLSRCKIGRVGGSKLGDLLSISTSLLNLDLSGNNLDSFSAERLAGALRVNRTLTQLDIRGNKLGDEGVKFMAGMLLVNSTLLVLQLGRNGLKGEQKVMQEMSEALVENTVLEELDLSHNTLGGLAVKTLTIGLTQNQVLKKLDLSYTQCGETGARAIYKLLVKEQVEAEERRKRMAARAARAQAEADMEARDTHGHETSDEESESEDEEEARLRELEAKEPTQIIRLCCRFEGVEKPEGEDEGNPDEDSALVSVGSAPKMGATAGGQLIVSGNDPSDDSGDDDDDEDVRVYVITKKDTYLSVKDMLVEEYGVNVQLQWEQTPGREDWAPLRSQHDLNDVFQAYAGKGMGRVEVHTKEIGEPLGLKTLNLANAMSDSHAAIVVEALRLNNCLQELDLSGCQLSDDSVQALTTALMEGKNGSLQRLLLAFNRIGLEGAKALANMLSSNKTLLLLDVGGNSFGRPATRALRLALENNQRLCILSQALMKHQGDGLPVIARIPGSMF